MGRILINLYQCIYVDIQKITLLSAGEISSSKLFIV